jgi:hypothetical protein
MLSLVSALVSCNGNSNRSNGNVYVADYTPSESSVTVTPEVANLGQGLDLQMLGEMVKNSTNAQDVEDKLNSTGSINNLDLDNDGNVDYVKVTEYGNGNNRGLSFTVDLAGGQTQEIATIQIENGNNNYANMNIQGNQNLYGNDGFYTSRYSVGDILLMHYLFAPHRYYVSPYRYGYYPRYYHPYHSVPSRAYHSRVVTSTRTTTIRRTSRPTGSASRSYSPNANKYSSSVTKRATSMARPTTSQRSFTTTSAAKSRPSTSGFRSSSSSSYSSSPSRSSSSSYSSSPSRSSSRSSSSFGSSSRSSSSSSRSSFGGSSRSSSSRRR